LLRDLIAQPLRLVRLGQLDGVRAGGLADRRRRLVHRTPDHFCHVDRPGERPGGLPRDSLEHAPREVGVRVGDTAFAHGDVTKFAEACAVDQRAIATNGEVLAGSNKWFAIASGTPLVRGRAATEHDVGDRSSPVSALRAPAEDISLALAERGVRSSVVRLPRCLHGASEDGWRGGLASRLIALAKEKGIAAYVGDGAPRWPADFEASFQ
jgi:hypothetical protein